MPAAPTGVLTSARTGEIIVTWKDVATESSYKVEVRSEDGSWVRLGDVAANITSFVHTNVAHGVSYLYRVAACNANGCSSWIEAGGKWDTGAPPQLSQVSASAIGSTLATFFARGYTGGLTTRVVFTLRKSGESTPVFVSEPITAAATGEIGEMGQSFVATLNFNSLTPGTDYQLSATASNNVGVAPPIPAATFRTLGPAPASP